MLISSMPRDAGRDAAPSSYPACGLHCWTTPMFRWITRWFFEARDIGRFKRLIEELAAPTLTFGERDKDQVLDEFVDMMVSRAGIAAILQEHGYDRPRAKSKLI